jgi:16S rRNA (cytosine967-C5)-methyltransferase
LIDAPCTGFGVIRRRPEILWRRKSEDVQTLAHLQRRILAESLRWLRPGGVLIYAVCTTTAEETTGVVSDHGGLPLFTTSPEQDGADGFYCARLSL